MSGASGPTVTVQMPSAPFVIGCGLPSSSPLTVTCDAFGARYRRVTVRSAPISGEITEGPPPPPPPRAGTEPATGPGVLGRSDEAGTASLYFHQNPYTAGGDKMIVSTPRGLSTIALATRAIAPLVEGRPSHLVVGPKTRQAFYILDG